MEWKVEMEFSDIPSQNKVPLHDADPAQNTAKQRACFIRCPAKPACSAATTEREKSKPEPE